MSTTSSGPNPDAALRMMQYDANKKSAGVAFILWLFLGMLGGHRFYLGMVGTGVLMLAFFVLSFLLSFVLIGYLGFMLLGLWAITDAFRIPGWVRKLNTRLIASLG